MNDSTKIQTLREVAEVVIVPSLMDARDPDGATRTIETWRRALTRTLSQVEDQEGRDEAARLNKDVRKAHLAAVERIEAAERAKEAEEAAATPPPYWVYIERQWSDADLMIGPYPDAEAAELAMVESLLIESYCQEDCVDCFTTQDQPDPQQVEVVTVDLTNKHHTG